MKRVSARSLSIWSAAAGALLAGAIAVDALTASPPKGSAATKPTTHPAPKPPEAPQPDLLTDAVDPYNPGAQRVVFFQAAGPDSEMDAKEYSADYARGRGARKTPAAPPASFARRFDRWSRLLAFDKNGNKTIDWFEADAYRRDLRRRVMAAYDRNKDGRLAGDERSAAIRALSAGRVPAERSDPRLVLVRPGRERPHRPPVAGGRAGEGERPGPAPGGEDARRAELLGRFDTDGDGRLGPAERQAMAEALRRDDVERKLLKRFDLDRDGALSDQEREAAVRAAVEKQRAEFMERYDVDRDGKLSDEERRAIREQRSAEFRETLERWRLQHFDENGDGRLSEDEEAEVKQFRKKMQQVGKEFRVVMADMDGDGKVSKEEEQAVQKEWRASAWRMMIKAARYMDSDGDGQVSMEERMAFGRRFGAAMVRWADTFIMKFDADRNGRVDKEERNALVAGFKEELMTRAEKFDADRDGRLNPEEAMALIEDFGKEIGITPPSRGKGKADRPRVRLPERFRRSKGRSPSGRRERASDRPQR